MGLFGLFKKKPKSSEEKVNVSVVFEEPKQEQNYNYPWDKRRPSSDTDFSNANFLCIFKKVHPLATNPDSFARSVSYNLHIYDPIKRQNELLKQGLIRLTSPVETLSAYKVTELKEILSNNNLPVTGKKADLIERIALNVDVEKINLPTMCCISEKGLEFVNQNQDLIKLANNPYNITYEEYITTKKELPGYLNYNDVIWSVFNRREMFSKGDYGIRHMNAYNRAKFLREEGKLIGALEHYIYDLFYNLNDPCRIIPEFMKEDYINENPMQIDHYLLEAIFELKEHFVIDMVDRCYERIDVPQLLIKRMDFERLLTDIFAGKEIDIKNYLPKGLR